MNHYTLNLYNNSRIHLVEDYFDSALADQLLQLFKTKDTNPMAWQVLPGQTHQVDRYFYVGDSSVLTAVTEYAESPLILKYLSDLYQTQVECYGVTLWLDQPGYSIPPHYDLDPTGYAVQIYITDTPDVAHGTTIHNTQNQVLAQLPLRHNYGYIIDKTYTINHGIEDPIPEGCFRNSVYMRYRPCDNTDSR